MPIYLVNRNHVTSNFGAGKPQLVSFYRICYACLAVFVFMSNMKQLNFLETEPRGYLRTAFETTMTNPSTIIMTVSGQGDAIKMAFEGLHFQKQEEIPETSNENSRAKKEEETPKISNEKISNNKKQEQNVREEIDRVCARIEKSLDMSSWAPVRYHKEYNENSIERRVEGRDFEPMWITSAEEDDADALATIREFNSIMKSDNPVLSKSLLDAGIQTGSDHRALRFLERMATSRGSDEPINIAVFGSSFTIGSNCKESTVHEEQHCSWPTRAKERLNELFSEGIGMPQVVAVDWHMWQENAQNSIIVANKLPGFIRSFHSKNKTLDAILLDTSITDNNHNDEGPWFEAVVRAIQNIFPDVVIVSITDGAADIVELNEDPENYIQWLRGVQQKYELTVVDMAKMVKILRSENSTAPDRLWPQHPNVTDATGIQKNDKFLYDIEAQTDETFEYYWVNFFPRVRKKTGALYASDHPPWPTHQYVADSVTQALLRTANQACALTKENRQNEIVPSLVPEDTVAEKERVDTCLICLKPLTSIDSKKLPEIDSSIVTPVCGDWKWITDERNRAGWQSDELGSLMRVRLRMGATDPLVSMTYTGSYETFGNLRVTFRTPDKEPLTECFGLSANIETLPSVAIDGYLDEYTLPKVATFTPHLHWQTNEEFQVFNATVLSQKMVKPEDGSEGQIIDMYIENIGDEWRHRSKIQMISAC